MLYPPFLSRYHVLTQYRFYRINSVVNQSELCQVFDYYSNSNAICNLGVSQPLDACALLLSPSPTPHPYTVSYYEGTIDPLIHQEQGCLARARGEQGVVVLDYGSPRIIYQAPFNIPTYAAGLKRAPREPTPTAPARLDQIKAAVEAYAAGYSKYSGCSPTGSNTPTPTPNLPSLEIAVGTTNSYLDSSGPGATPTFVPNPALGEGHGKAWANMVLEINSDLQTNGYSGISAAGAYDAEPGWWQFSAGANPTPTYNWAYGYDSVPNRRPYYDFGSIDGGIRDSTWELTQSNQKFDQVYDLAYGIGAALPLPEAYN